MENPATKHAEFLKLINDEFHVAEIMFSKEGLQFDTNSINSWSVMKGDQIITISSKGIKSFVVHRKTNNFNDIMELILDTNDYSVKYRKTDLINIIGEGYIIRGYKKESDVNPNDTKRFFELSAIILKLIDEKVELLMHVNPRSMYSVACADLLYEMLGPLMLKLKQNQNAISKIESLRQDFDNINQKNQHDEQKFYVLLDGLEEITRKFV